MEVTVFRLPITNAALNEIVTRLAAQDVFTPSWGDSGPSCYDLAVYLREQQQHEVTAAFLVDRNVLGRVVGLANGAAAEGTHRTAAAVLAFAQCCGGAIEPNIALYELAQQQGNDAAVAELAMFRRADLTSPALWADIAVGASRSLETIAEPRPPGPHDQDLDFTMSLRNWNRNYILVLKLAALELAGGSAVDRMSRLMNWAFNDFALRGPALLLAAHYLAPGAPRRRLLKKLRAVDRDLAVRGLQNAAWDVTYVSEWLSRFDRYDSHKETNILVSMDRALHILARAAIDADRQPTAFAEGTLTRLWGERDGRRLAEQLAGHYASQDDPNRQVKRPAPPDYIGQLIRDGEKAIRSWRPA